MNRPEDLTDPHADAHIDPRIDPDVERRWVSVDHPWWTQAHAPSLLVRPGTDALVTWFAGTREGTPDNRIWLARRGARGRWTEPEIVAQGEVAHWNPVLTEGPDGALWLFYKRGERISTWSTWFVRSTDDARTWTSPRLLVTGDSGGRGPVKNPPILLEDAVWLAPASTETWHPRPRWQPFVDRSVDEGRTWTAVEIPVDHARLRGAGLIQPALWHDTAGVHALMRSTEGWAYLSSSTDAGLTWSRARPVELPNNNSGLSVARLPDGSVACVHNPAGASWGPRCPLVVSVSADGGQTWRRAATVEDGRTPVNDEPRLRPRLPAPGPGFTGADDGVVTDGAGEYSYPSAAVLDSALHVAYTWQRRGIVTARIPLDLLIGPTHRTAHAATPTRPLPPRGSPSP